ncbi:carbon catabolite repressor protein 4 homolog 6 isoform X1 [Ziziphus jujuba]|uniref:Carbon catabolite repressor protein 4 homolog 6 isoform X1 n=1 Tax=Ziziphus jujuba TaxID=326968 RepID=A0A6P3ZW62_ZIZJJ|nr:carbon catabolite repressor protein 4 homolog 6 isoform X1 [Ziziphus jujuba]
MRRRLHPLQYVVVVPTDASTASNSTAVMSSRSPYRGGLNQQRRTFSDRSYSGGRGNYVTGDSHFQSVRETNLGYRQGDSGGFANRGGYQPPSFGARPFRPPHQNQSQQFRPSTANNPNQHLRRYPPFDQNQARRMRPQFMPRPPDYRNWEYAKMAPPPASERFTILSYNILADYLATNHRSKLYYHIPLYMMDWEWRKKKIFFELGLWSPDIMCFQEVDRFKDLEEEFRLRGYNGVWKMRTGNAIDGCAIFWRASRFKLLHEESIEFNKLGLRDNVAQICVLEMMSRNSAENTAALQRNSTDSNKVVVCNIHVLYNPKRGEIKLGQVRVLLDRAHAISKLWNDAPVVLCGDFNCIPKSPLYNFILQQKLDLSGLDRDKLSGQAYAEIPIQRTHNYIPGHADNLVQAPSVVQGKNVDIQLSNSSLNIQKPYHSDSSVETVPSVNNFSQPQSSDSLNVFDNPCTKVEYGKDNGAQHDMKEEIQQNAVNCSKVGGGSAFCVPGDVVNENITTAYGEACLSVHHFNDDIHISSPTVSSHPEEADFNMTDMGDKERVDSVSSLDPGLLSRHFDSNDDLKDKSYADNPMLSLYGDNHSMQAKVDLESLDPLIAEIPSSDPSHEACLSDTVEVCLLQSGNISSQPISSDAEDSSSDPCKLNASPACTSIEAQEKLENLCLNELDEAMTGGNKAEDVTTFSSALHNTEDAFPSDHGELPRSDLTEPDRSNDVDDDLSLHLDSEPSDVGKYIYDPSSWTPMEIETATGKADCTSLEHPLKLRSTYTEVEGSLETRGLSGEPLVTSYNRCFLGTVDYIWHSEGLQTVRVLAPIPKHVMQKTPGFPTKKWGSDHIALASELAFIRDETDDATEVQ